MQLSASIEKVHSLHSIHGCLYRPFKHNVLTASMNMMLLNEFSPPWLMLGLKAKELSVSCSPSPTYTHTNIVSKNACRQIEAAQDQEPRPQNSEDPVPHPHYIHAHPRIVLNILEDVVIQDNYTGPRILIPILPSRSSGLDKLVRICSAQGYDVNFSSVSNQLT